MTTTYDHYRVEFTYYPSSRGACDSLGGIRGAGPPLEPDTPAEVEIEQVVDLDTNLGVDICDIPEHILDKITEVCLQQASSGDV